MVQVGIKPCHRAKNGRSGRAGLTREGTLNRLAEAQLHVLQGSKLVDTQRKLIAVLEAEGPARLIPEATKLLRYFEKELALHVEDRDRLTKELEQTKK